MTVTVHGPGGYPKPPYGSFAGKSPAAGDSKSYVQPFSVLGPGGYPRPPYASFAGKTTTKASDLNDFQFIANVGKLMGH